MGASIGAALKKIAAALLSNKKVLKKVLVVVLTLVLVLFMPLAALIAVLTGNIKFDVNELQAILEGNMSTEEQERLQGAEDAQKEIESQMTAAGYDAQRTKEAQVLYTLAIDELEDDGTLISRLVTCFADGQTDDQLIAAVNAEFGITIEFSEFSNVMAPIRVAYIPTDQYTDPATKNNLDIAEWAKCAVLEGWGYVCGTYGEVLTESLLDTKASEHPDEVSGKKDFIAATWMDRRTADCVGLIKGYGWLNPETHEIEYATNGMPDIGPDDMYNNAAEKGTIDTIPEIPGLAVWVQGHIGIYIGDGKVVEAKNMESGVQQTELIGGPWTNWLKIPYISYIEQPEETEPEETEPEATGETVPETTEETTPETTGETE